MIKATSSPFGGLGRTRVLLALRLLGESHGRELARLLGMPASSVVQALGSLERDGLVAGRAVGRLRLFRLDPRYFAHDDLRRYLARLAEPETALLSRVASLRRRPRRAGKPL
jgi:DNA-binding transcriptional ArsR family regulator